MHSKLLNENPIDFVFSETGEAGQALLCGWDASDDDKETIIRVLIEDAHRHLPEGSVFEVRGKRKPYEVGEEMVWPLGECDEDRHRAEVREWGIAWYYSPDDGNPRHMIRGELFRSTVSQAKFDIYTGCFIFARIKT